MTFFFRFHPSFGTFTFSSTTYIKLPQVGIRTGNVEKWKKKNGKNFSTQEKCVEHSLKNLGPSQKTLRPTWCPKLVIGLDPPSYKCWFGHVFMTYKSIVATNFMLPHQKSPTINSS